MKRGCPFLMCLFVTLSTFLLSCGGGSDANRCKITVAATTGGKVKISKYLETSENVLYGSEVEVVAMPDDNYAFTGWYIGYATEPVSTDAVFTFIATKNSTLTAHFAKSRSCTRAYSGMMGRFVKRLRTNATGIIQHHIKPLSKMKVIMVLPPARRVK